MIKLSKTLKWLKEYSGLISVILFLTVFIFGTLKDCSHSYENNIQEYESNAVKFRPMIVLSEAPKIKELFYELDTSWIKYYTGIHAIKGDVSDPKTIPMTGIITKLQFKLKNKNPIPTDIIAVIVSDTNSMYQFLKYDFVNRKIQYSDDLYSNIYKRMKLVDNQVEVIEFNNYRIKDFNDSTFTIHLNVIYENELGVIYYSYYTIKFEPTKTEFYISYEQIKKWQKYPYNRIGVKGDAAKIIDVDFDSKFYSFEFALLIDKFLYRETDKIDKEIQDGKKLLND